MNASYRLGLAIVAGTILGSAVLVYAAQALRPAAAPPRAGQDLGDLGYDLGSYNLTERSGKTVTEADLAGEVWVSAFIFTRCPVSCPKISSVMKTLQQPLGDAGVKLVSLSVDPDFDTPAVLTQYANGLGADPDRWWFLTGPRDAVVSLIIDKFHLPLSRNDAADLSTDARAEAVQHSPRLVLVDRGNKVVGFFDSDDPEAVKALLAMARRKASWARQLPAVNAGLNGSCAILLLLGWTFILTRNVKAHAVCQISAVAVSAVFLACYLVYHFEVGSVAFRGVGWTKSVYLTILLSHTLLATFGVVPLVGLTLLRAVRREFPRHAAIARVTFPIWLYVSITGVVIYWMLYQLPVMTVSS